MSKDLIIKANALVEASYHLTANEQRLILSAIAQVPKNGAVRDDRIYPVSADDFIALGVHQKTAYREMEEAMERLFERTVNVKFNGAYLKTRWVQSIGKIDRDLAQKLKLIPNDELSQIDENSCVYGIQFSHQVLPFLTNLTSNFTKYKLTEIAGFSSAYSYRIYEFLMQFQSTGYIKISINDLRERLQLGNKYPANKDLKVRVIDPAIKEINEKSPYSVKYKLLKKGRKFTHLEIKFELKNKETKKKEKPKILDQKDPNTIDISDNLTDKECEIVAQKNAYADQIGATAEHRENLINQALIKHRQAKQDEQERLEREKAKRQAQEIKDKEQLALAKQQYKQILASDELIELYMASNINHKLLSGLQKVYFEQANFKGVFQMEKHKFEKLHYLTQLNLQFLEM